MSRKALAACYVVVGSVPALAVAIAVSLLGCEVMRRGDWFAGAVWILAGGVMGSVVTAGAVSVWRWSKG